MEGGTAEQILLAPSWTANLHSFTLHFDEVNLRATEKEDCSLRA